MKEDGSYDVAAIKTKFSKPNSIEAVQKKLDEVTQTYCQDKGTSLTINYIITYYI